MLCIMADCAPGQFYIVVRQLSYGHADLFIQPRGILPTRIPPSPFCMIFMSMESLSVFRQELDT